jgi:WD40 repeat protein
MYKPIIKLTGHQGAIYSLVDSISPYFYSVGGDGFVVQWNKIGNNHNGKLIAKADHALYCAHLISNQNLFLCGGMQGSIYWIDMTENEIIKDTKLHTNAIYDIAHIDDTVITCGADGKLIFWNGTSMTPELILQVSNQALRCMVYHDGKIYVGCSDKNLYICDASSRRIVSRHMLHANSIFSLMINHEKLYSGSRDAKINVHNITDISILSKIDAHNATINSLCTHEGFIISASKDKSLRIWQPDGKLVQSLNAIYGGHINSVNKVITLSDTPYFASASDDKSIVIWGNE